MIGRAKENYKKNFSSWARAFGFKVMTADDLLDQKREVRQGFILAAVVFFGAIIVTAIFAVKINNTSEFSLRYDRSAQISISEWEDLIMFLWSAAAILTAAVAYMHSVANKETSRLIPLLRQRLASVDEKLSNSENKDEFPTLRTEKVTLESQLRQLGA